MRERRDEGAEIKRWNRGALAQTITRRKEISPTAWRRTRSPLFLLPPPFFGFFVLPISLQLYYPSPFITIHPRLVFGAPRCRRTVIP